MFSYVPQKSSPQKNVQPHLLCNLLPQCNNFVSSQVNIDCRVEGRTYLTKNFFYNDIICFDFYETSIMSLRRRFGEGFANFIIYIVAMGMACSAQYEQQNKEIKCYKKHGTAKKYTSFYCTRR